MELTCKMENICKKKFGILRSSGPHNPEVVGSSPASATIKNTGFRKKSGVFLTFWTKMEDLKPSIGVSLGLYATCTKEKTELF